MTKHLLALAATLALASPAFAQEPAQPAPSPNEIVNGAQPSDWVAIAPEDLLVMTLAADAQGNARKVVIQLMPAPFSQGWVENIRTLARAGWYDDISVNRVQDNYVVQWGDPNYDNPEAEGEAKPLPEGLRVMDESEYTVDADTLSDVASEAVGDSEWVQFFLTPEMLALQTKMEAVMSNPTSTQAERLAAIDEFLKTSGLMPTGEPTEREKIAMISISKTTGPSKPHGWHERDSYAEWTEFWRGWPIANYEIGEWTDEEGDRIPTPDMPSHEAAGKGYYKDVSESFFWPVHCYAMVGVGRSMSPDTGSGAELYSVIGHAPRHLDRNIALVGRIVEGMEHLSSLPRGSGPLGFYRAEEAAKRTPILSVRVSADLPAGEQPQFQYLSTESESFARYAQARANRRDPFFIVPAGGADICNIPVPVRRVSE